ncbi:MAG TPA: hypothetical protein P5307_02045, partial [Pirellulaceae bacterium]|nr:hypothetical protein [Pirellulaceae bacterium]
ASCYDDAAEVETAESFSYVEMNSAPASAPFRIGSSTTSPSTSTPATSSSTRSPSPKAVDSVIVSLTDELTDSEFPGELVHLGLDELFAGV